MGSVYLQMCKIIRPFLGKIENEKQENLQQSSIGVAVLATFSSVWPEALEMLAKAFAAVD